jgi:ankyrin repeat protein
MLLQSGADKDAKTVNGNTPLHAAAYHGSHEVVQLLLEAGADKDAQFRGGVTPLHHAARQGHIGVALMLVRAGANKEATTDNGDTPIHGAVSRGHLDVVQMLMEEGADLGARTAAGKTAEDLAAEGGMGGASTLLRDARVSRAIAFLMGQHESLGSGSWLRSLEPGVVQMIAREASLAET